MATVIFPDSSRQSNGWRIEQKYALGVLIGNWYESRHGKFKRGTYPRGDSATKSDYHQYPTVSYNPDVSTRRKGLLINDGLRKDHIFTHHGRLHFNNRISTYDQEYNRKYRTGLRHWDKYSISWLPEKSDHPIQGISTNFGLKERLEEKRKDEKQDINDLSTTYELSYRDIPTTTFSRAATPRPLSSHLHPHNTLKNLHLRGTPLIVRSEVVDPKLMKLSDTV